MTRILLVLTWLFLILPPVEAAKQAKKGKSSKSAATAVSSKSTRTSTGKSAQASSKKKRAKSNSAVASKRTATKSVRVRTTTRYSGKGKRRRYFYDPYSAPTFADSTLGDNIDGEDLTVRRAAVEALGGYNGTVVVAEPDSGRVLTIVNQKLALTGVYQPCSTIKLVAAIAGLNEGLIDRDTMMRLGRRSSMNLTHALAVSNNPYFTNIGNRLGFDRIVHYGRLLGLGEKAGWEIQGESAGVFPEEKPKGMPVGMMMSYGERIGMTPLQLTGIISAIANGGTLYYLQYPRTPLPPDTFLPRVKRQLDIGNTIPDLRPGMLGTVAFGSGRRAFYDSDEPIFGKTGTCSDLQAHLGWFASFNEVSGRKLSVVVLLTGGRKVNGPLAAGIAGKVFKNLSDSHYFMAAARAETPEPAAPASEPVTGSLSCCSQ